MTQKLGTIIADFETSLATKLAIGATSGTLQSVTDDDGVTLPTGRYFLTIDGNNASKEHIACTLTSTALTSIVSVSRQGVETSGVVRAHRVGAKVVITDFANLLHLTKQLNGTEALDSTSPLLYDTDPTITDDKHLATKKYADSLAIAGSPLATESVQGITKLSVAAVSAILPIAVGDNDTRVPTQDENDALVGTSGTAVSSSNKLVDSADVTEAKTASKIVRRDANGDVLVATTPTSGDAATSKTYVDGFISTSYNNGISSSHSCATTWTETIAHGLGRLPLTIRFQCGGTAVYSASWVTSSQGTYIKSSNSNKGTYTFSGGGLGNDSGSFVGVNYTSSYGSQSITVTDCNSTTFTVTATGTIGISSAMKFSWDAN